MQTPLPSPFYRVAIAALVFDDQQRLLVVQNSEHHWELPGGGWEHDEDMEACIRRELKEELTATVTSCDSHIAFMYRAPNVKRGFLVLRLAVRVVLSNHTFTPADNMLAAKFVTKDELLALDMAPDQATVKDNLDQIW